MRLLLALAALLPLVGACSQGQNCTTNATGVFFINDFAFTPWWSLLGGVLIGLTSVVYLFVTGRLAAISGILAKTIIGDVDYGFRLAFVSGLLVCGGFMGLFPQTASATTSVFSIATGRVTPGWFPVGGILVGLGSSLQSGCTSGHGVCGVSRLSPKSVVLTIVFLATGFAIATLIRPLHPAPASSFVLPDFLIPFLTTGPFAVGIWCLGAAVRADVRSLIAFACAVVFAVGLFVGGMTNTVNIVGFLCIANVSNAAYDGWNPSLAFVMGGAIAVAVIPFQYLVRKKDGAWPVAPLALRREEQSFGPWVPPTSWKLFKGKGGAALGAVLFGMGWALSGLCPGPAIVVAGSGLAPEVTLFFLPFLALGLLNTRSTTQCAPCDDGKREQDEETNAFKGSHSMATVLPVTTATQVADITEVATIE